MLACLLVLACLLACVLVPVLACVLVLAGLEAEGECEVVDRVAASPCRRQHHGLVVSG